MGSARHAFRENIKSTAMYYNCRVSSFSGSGEQEDYWRAIKIGREEHRRERLTIGRWWDER